MTKRFLGEITSGDQHLLRLHGDKPPSCAFDLERPLESDGRLREVNEEGVVALMRSYEKDGEFTPILIRVWPLGEPSTSPAVEHARTPRLIDGAHRLDAAKRLGLKTILAWMVECSDTEAETMEIAANLYRTELTPAERGQQMIVWCRLHGLPVPGDNSTPNTGCDDAQRPTEPDASAAEPDKLGSPTQFCPSSPPVFPATTPRGKAWPRSADDAALSPGGRGKRGTASQVADVFGVSKKTALSNMAAARAAACAAPAEPRIDDDGGDDYQRQQVLADENAERFAEVLDKLADSAEWANEILKHGSEADAAWSVVKVLRSCIQTVFDTEVVTLFVESLRARLRLPPLPTSQTHSKRL
jgi:ParB-like nuclease family protein